MFLVSCSDNNGSGDESSPPADTQTFTFFELGKTTRLTNGVRSDLRDKLGRDAIERRSILNLEINRQGFLKTYFPELAGLNKQVIFQGANDRVEIWDPEAQENYTRSFEQEQSLTFDDIAEIFD